MYLSLLVYGHRLEEEEEHHAD